MNESKDGCEQLICTVEGGTVIDIYLISHTPACMDAPRCGRQSAAVRDKMYRETHFEGRLRLPPTRHDPGQHFSSNMVCEEKNTSSRLIPVLAFQKQ